jgi:uncharacterized membrane protein
MGISRRSTYLLVRKAPPPHGRDVVLMMWTVIIGVFLAGGALGAFVTLVIGIHTEERHMSLKGDPHTAASASTRRVLAHVRQSDNDIAKFAI